MRFPLNSEAGIFPAAAEIPERLAIPEGHYRRPRVSDRPTAGRRAGRRPLGLRDGPAHAPLSFDRASDLAVRIGNTLAITLQTKKKARA